MIDIRSGDCEVLMTKMPEDTIDLIITDPPYGINYKSNRQQLDRKECLAGRGEIKVRETYFDNIINDQFLPTAWLHEAHRVLKNNSAIYIFCHWAKWHELYPVVASLFTVKNMIVLNKSNHGMGDLNGQYAPKHELLLYAVKGRHLLNREHGRGKDVWDVPIRFTGARRLHPNEKPIKWITPCILNSCHEGGIVLDPFAGSGAVGAACIELNRSCILIDIDDNWCHVMRERLS